MSPKRGEQQHLDSSAVGSVGMYGHNISSDFWKPKKETEGEGLGFGPGDPSPDPLEPSQVLIHRHLQNLLWLSQFHREEVIQCPPGSREARKVKEDGHFSKNKTRERKVSSFC